MNSTLLTLGAFAVLLGAAVGSFAGVVAARGPRASLRGRSRCDSCARILAWFELVPLFSYALLRGRCRTCHARVGRAVLAWELGGALVALIAVLPAVILSYVPAV